jgi:hypothetical protein
MSIHADYDFDFDADLDEAAFAEQERQFEAFMQEQGFVVSEDEQVRYEEWCEGQELDPAEDHWESYYDSMLPDDEDW